MTASAFLRQTDVFLDRSASLSDQSKMLAEVAKAGVAGLIASGQAPARYRRYVDGRKGAPEESVRAGGVIVYQFDRMPEIVGFALAFLRARSPNGPAEDGHFRDSFYLGLDGRFVRMAGFSLESMRPDTAEVIIGNTQPYNREVDVQVAGGRPLRFSVPAGLFADAVKAIRARFGATVTVSRIRSIDFPGRYTLKGRWGEGRKVESPAIIITARQ